MKTANSSFMARPIWRKAAWATALACSSFVWMAQGHAQSTQAEQINKLTSRLDALEEQLATQGLSGFTISGQMDPTYIWTSHNKGSFNFLDDYSTSASTYENGGFGRVIVDLNKAMENGTMWSLRLNFNKAATGVVDKAMVTVPVGEGTNFFAGLVPDWSGYEYGDATLNKLITHNLAFDYLYPTYYLGAGFEFSVGDSVHKVMVGNLNKTHTTKSDGNTAPVLTYRFDWSQGDSDPFSTGYGIGGSAHVGHQKFGTQKNSFALVEVDFFRISGALEYSGNIFMGKMRHSAFGVDDEGNHKTAQWSGLGGQILYRTTPQLALIARADYINNSKNGGGVFWINGAEGDTGANNLDGFGPNPNNADKGVNRFALSLGANYTYNENTAFKFEIRRDRANGQVFGKNWDASVDNGDGTFGAFTESSRSRNLIGASVVVNF